eukprot:2936144-Heterocapsa_arctica.AAC.1
MYQRWYSSSSCVPQLMGQVKGVPSTTSVSLACDQVPPARMFLRAPASLGAVASNFLSIFLGMVQVDHSLQPVQVSSVLDCLPPDDGRGPCDGHLLDEFR